MELQNKHNHLVYLLLYSCTLAFELLNHLHQKSQQMNKLEQGELRWHFRGAFHLKSRMKVLFFQSRIMRGYEYKFDNYY